MQGPDHYFENPLSGIVKAKKIEKMGMHCSDTGLIYFEDVRVPAANIIGEEGMGFTYQMMQFQEERLVAASNSLQPLANLLSGKRSIS